MPWLSQSSAFASISLDCVYNRFEVRNPDIFITLGLVYTRSLVSTRPCAIRSPNTCCGPYCFKSKQKENFDTTKTPSLLNLKSATTKTQPYTVTKPKIRKLKEPTTNPTTIPPPYWNPLHESNNHHGSTRWKIKPRRKELEARRVRFVPLKAPRLTRQLDSLVNNVGFWNRNRN